MTVAVARRRSLGNPLTVMGGLFALLLIAVGMVAAVDTDDAFALVGCGIVLLIFSIGVPMAAPITFPTIGRRTLWTIVGVAIVAIFLAAGWTWASRADRLANEARVLYKKQDYRRAAEMFGRAIAISPKDAALHTDLGWSYLGQNQCFPARDAFQTALRIEPGSAQASRGLEVASRCAGLFR